MQHSEIPILSTRPIDSSLIRNCEEAGFSIDVLPFITTEPISTAMLQQRIENYSKNPIAVAFTSMKAAEKIINDLAGRIPHWRIFCTGPATRRTLANYFGDKAICGVAGTADGVADEIVASTEKHVVFFCGEHHREDLPQKLRAQKIEVHEVIVYRTILLSHQIQKKYCAVLFFSPTAVLSFFKNNAVEKDVLLFAIGPTTAASIRKYCNNRIVQPVMPDQNNLIEKLVECYSEIRELKLKRN